jgi:ABC-2 type transport system permease protein
MSDVYAIWIREMIKFMRARARVVGMLVQPILWLAIFGVGFGSFMKNTPGMSTNYITFLAPGVVGMTILFTSMYYAMGILIDRQFGFMKEMIVAPVSKTSIILGKSLGGATRAVLSGLIVVAMATILGANFMGQLGAIGLPLVFLIMFVVGLGFVNLSIAIASKMSGLESFEAIANFIVMPIYFLSGAIFPNTILPNWLQYLSYVNPLTYGVDALRYVIGVNNMPIEIDLTVLAVFLILSMLLAFASFKRR